MDLNAKELVHKIPDGQLELSINDENAPMINAAEICFKTKYMDVVDLAQVLYNEENHSLEILVYSDPLDECYTHKFNISIQDIEEAFEVPF